MSDLVPQALDRLVEELRRYAAYQLEYGGADKRSDDVRLMSRAANRIEALEAESAALREQVASGAILPLTVGGRTIWPITYMAYADCINPTHWRPLPAPPATDGEG